AIHFPPPEGDLRERIAAGGPLGPLLWEAERSLPAEDPAFGLLEARIGERISFDDGLPLGTEIEGEAFALSPAPGPIRRQNLLRNQRGPGLLNSFQPDDRAKGRLYLPRRRLDGSPIHLLVGGSADCGRVFVGLEVE